MEPDRIGLEGGINPYIYANVNSISNVDPSGLETTGEFIDRKAMSAAGNNDYLSLGLWSLGYASWQIFGFENLSMTFDHMLFGRNDYMTSNAAMTGVELFTLGKGGAVVGLTDRFFAKQAAIRQTYWAKLAEIPNTVHRTNLPLKEKAEMAANMRNAIKLEQRANMPLGSARILPRPSTFNEIYQRTINKGFKGDGIYDEIIHKSSKSNGSVDRLYKLVW